MANQIQLRNLEQGKYYRLANPTTYLPSIGTGIAASLYNSYLQELNTNYCRLSHKYQIPGSNNYLFHFEDPNSGSLVQNFQVFPNHLPQGYDTLFIEKPPTAPGAPTAPSSVGGKRTRKSKGKRKERRGKGRKTRGRK